MFGARPWLDAVAPAPASRRLRGREWLSITLAVGVTLALMVVGYIFFFPSRQEKTPSPVVKEWDSPSLRERFDRAKHLLEQGQYGRSAKELPKMARAVLEAKLKLAEVAAWQQLEREAGVLAALLTEPLEDLPRRAAVGAPEEWQVQFESRYHGKSFILDAEFYVGENGVWQVDYAFGLERIKLVVGNLQVLTLVPKKTRQRLIVGVRLEALRQVDDAWIIDVAADSGVLLTNAEALVRACPPLGDDATRELLQRQAEWVAGLK